MDTYGSDSSRQIQVRFVTKLEPPLKAPASSIAVPSYLNRMGLSEIVNSLLKSVSSEFEPQPFDFLIDGELVRMSLEQFLLAKGISAERVLEIEYIKVVAPREQKDPCLHDDWVSAVDGSDPRVILTGCYDNISRIWKTGSLCTHILEGHTGAVTSVSILNTTAGVENGNIRLATGSKDRTLRLWMLDVAGKVDYPMKIGAYKVLNGHMASVQSISSAPLGDKICSGSWDCSVKLWKVNDSEVEGDSVSIKKRKLVSDMVEESQAEIEAMSSFVGHTQCVSSVTWPELETIYSASWDHSIRSWDVETGKSPWNMVSGKVLNCLDVGGRELIAAGGSDPILRIWDPRKPGTLAPIFQFSSHTSWITACKWHSSSQFHLVSASYDGKVMLWDLRTAWPLAVIDSHKDKVLCVDWWKGDSVVSGGADSKLCISSGISIQ